MLKKVLFVLALALSAMANMVSAETPVINVAFGDKVYAMKVAQVCGKPAVSKNGYKLPVGAAEDGTLVVGTQAFPQYICAKRLASGGGGGNTTIKEQGKHTGQSAEQVADNLGLPEGSVETIDPGPVVASGGVIDTNDSGSSNDEAESVTAEGATQEDTQPDPAPEGEPQTDGGNTGVDIF
jgi:hypothetical protein